MKINLTFQARIGFDGLWYVRNLSGDSKWGDTGFTSKEKAIKEIENYYSVWEETNIYWKD